MKAEFIACVEGEDSANEGGHDWLLCLLWFDPLIVVGMGLVWKLLVAS